MREGGDQWGWPPTGALLYTQREDHWSLFNSSINVVSFGFVATAILISMFFVMAIFKRFLRPTLPVSQPFGRRYNGNVESQMGFNGKPHLPSPRAILFQILAFTTPPTPTKLVASS